jgi:DNA invertase Pin-like site-specific DNA recombinase
MAYDSTFMVNGAKYGACLEKSRSQFGRAVGQARYAQSLAQARQEGQAIGVSPHMLTPTAPLSRLGFKGKKPSKKALEEAAAKLLKAACTNPSLKAAAMNAVAACYARGCKVRL